MRGGRGEEKVSPGPRSPPSPCRRLSWLDCTVLIGLLLAGCGRGGAADVGPVAQRPPRPLPLATATPPPQAIEIALYLPRLFEDDSLGLRRVSRTIVPSGEPARDAVEALIRGPNGDERAADIQYPLDRRTRVLAARVEGGLVELELDDEGLRLVHGRPYSELVFWSIVYTLTEAPGVDGVMLLREGRPLLEFGSPPVAVPPGASRRDAPAWVRPR